MVPKTTTFKQVKSQAAATRAKLKGEKSGDGAAAAEAAPVANGSSKKQKSIMNGTSGFPSRGRASIDGDPNSQLEMEMRQAARQGQGQDGDVDMTG